MVQLLTRLEVFDMAKIEPIVKIVEDYRIIFIPVASYRRIGEAEILKVFGIPVWKRVGVVSSLFGFGYIDNALEVK